MKRQPNETQEEYKARRAEKQQSAKNKLSGKYILKSYPKNVVGLKNTPYKKPKDVERQGFTKALRNAKGYGKHLENKTFGL